MSYSKRAFLDIVAREGVLGYIYYITNLDAITLPIEVLGYFEEEVDVFLEDKAYYLLEYGPGDLPIEL